MRQLADIAAQVVPLGHRKVGQVIRAELQFDVATPRQLDRVFQRFGNIGEQRRHLVGRFQILLVAVVARALVVGQHAALVDANARLVRLEVVLQQKTHVVAGHDRQIEFDRQRQRESVPVFFAVAAAAGQFEVQPIRKKPRQWAQFRQRGIESLIQGDAADLALASE